MHLFLHEDLKYPSLSPDLCKAAAINPYLHLVRWNHLICRPQKPLCAPDCVVDHDLGWELPTPKDIAGAAAVLKPLFYSAGYPEVDRTHGCPPYFAGLTTAM